jgi:transcriptional regulator with XRE-family HTH domain
MSVDETVDEFFHRLRMESPAFEAAGAEVDPPHFLAINVLQLRTARGMTQAALAKEIGIAQPRIAEIERGESNPRLTTIGRLARALETTVSDLLRAPPDHYSTRPLRAPGEEPGDATEPRRKVG